MILRAMSSQMKNETSTFLHKIYTNDPVLFKNYVNKRLNVTTVDGRVHSGIVYTIDPVSESIVIMESVDGEEKMNMKIIMRQSVKAVECSEDVELVLPEIFTPAEISDMRTDGKKSFINNQR